MPSTLSTTDLGFEPKGLYGVDVSWTRGMDAGARFQQAWQVVDVLRSVPGVVAAGGADINPLTGAMGMRTLGPGLARTSRWHVMDGFFDTMGMRVVAGRTIDAAEAAVDAPVGVLSESGLRVVWPDVVPAEAIGKVLRFPAVSPLPALYLPLSAKGFRLAQFVIRMAPESVPVLSQVRSRLLQAGVAASSVSLRNVDDGLRVGLVDHKFRAIVFSAFGLTALILAAVGLHAVGAYEVALRQREVGIRLAIGGSAPSVQWLIVRQALVPVILGILAGLTAAFWAAKFIQAFLYQVDARDPAMLGMVTMVLLGATAIAAWLPAYRAAHLDPAAVLRAE